MNNIIGLFSLSHDGLPDIFPKELIDDVITRLSNYEKHGVRLVFSASKQSSLLTHKILRRAEISFYYDVGETPTSPTSPSFIMLLRGKHYDHRGIIKTRYTLHVPSDNGRGNGTACIARGDCYKIDIANIINQHLNRIFYGNVPCNDGHNAYERFTP